MSAMSLFRVKARWTGFSGAPGYTVLHFEAPDDAAGPSPEDCVTAVHTFFDSIRDRLPSVVSVQVEGAVERLEIGTGQLIGFDDVTPPSLVIGAMSGGFSSATGACVGWATNGVRNGRRVRGRTFIVPLGAGTYDTDGTLNSIALTDIQTAASALAADFAGLVVYARETAPGAADGVAYDVAGARVADKTAILRSRRD